MENNSNSDVQGPDPAEGLAIINAQRALVRDRVEPDSRWLFGLWGVAWIVGYLALYVTARDSAEGAPSAWSFAVFGVCIVGAIALTIVHVIRRSSGLKGMSARSGIMYGWAWTFGFIGLYLVNAGLARAGASQEVLNLAWNALPAFLVGVMYMAGGALWQSRVIYILGAWIVLIGGVATLIGGAPLYLVMALAGGGGMLICAVLEHVVVYRPRRNRKAI